MQLKVPVVLIIFNRPDLTRLVFAAIKKAKPERLFIVADGPRFDSDIVKCNETRNIIEEVDWSCKVEINFSEKNMGCGLRIKTGLDWVFSKVEDAIILEDDCLPAESFFEFCQTLLNYYKDDDRVMHISGNNFGFKNRGNSYFFSKYVFIWGWATWKRAWQKCDFEMLDWDNVKTTSSFRSKFYNNREYDYWVDSINYSVSSRIDAWGYRWQYTCFVNNGLAIIPSVNLVTNLGFREDSVHTKDTKHPHANIQVSQLSHITHFYPIIVNKKFDYHLLLKVYKDIFRWNLRRTLGQVGIFLKKYTPKLYVFLKRSKLFR